ncbi:MAG: ribulose-phosphate 3-epimerase [Candidatus Methanoperedens sp.]|jgi:ribulose-phosphate 3-epimerase|nr:ribulose-phosphate 3-epimerase [Candidatus Methanoperedens sp.]PKL54326.1 MAG: ribulose-phosphate 3-epimerase [Candidatus Methanoperedenaceae archaeon HGW-Methanoperedenaceae-1]
MKNRKMIIPAIIARTQKELDKKLNTVEGYSELVQLDIMDGRFVPNNSLDFDFDVSGSNTSFEAHLMITDPMGWIEKNWWKVDTIIVHFESCEKPGDIIRFVKDKGKNIGFAINPETAVHNVKPYLDDIDQLLVMTVNPGFYGGKFLPETLSKISEARKIKPDLDIEVDGGVTPETIKSIDDAGANMFVSGSYILKSDGVKEAIDSLRKLIQ